jgi:two-component system, sensor histidine kinase
MMRACQAALLIGCFMCLQVLVFDVNSVACCAQNNKDMNLLFNPPITSERRTAADDSTQPSKPSLSQRVFGEQIYTLYESMGYSLKSSVFTTLLTVLVCQMWVGWAATLAWGLGMCALFLLRFYGVRQYQLASAKVHPNAPMTPAENQRWADRAALGTGATGALWGAAGVVFFPAGQMEYQVFLIVMLIGMVTAAAFAQASYLPAFRLFLLGIGVPTALVMLYQATLMQSVLAMLCVMYAVVLHRLVVISHRRLLETFRLRFQTQELAVQLAEQVRRADEANLAKSQFLSAASHDLRQPLHAMELFTTALHYQEMTSPVRDVVGKLGKSISAMRSLLDALMDISRLDAGVVQTRIGVVNLRALVDGIAEEFIPVAAEKGLQLSYLCPPLAATLSDEVLLRSILMNLVSNAVRYTDQGRILITCRRSQGRWLLAVYDTGRGIADDEQLLVFKEFVQLDNPLRDRNAGLGLGLAIIKRQAALLGHQVSLSSRKGRGSCFSVSLPLAQAAVPLQTSTPDAVVAERFGAHRCVVVVDDDLGVRDAMQLLLESWGFQVVAAASPPLAMLALAGLAEKPALLLCDWQLVGDTNGIDAVEELREFFNDDKLPALLITGETDAANLSAADRSGVPVLNKPVRASVLRAQILLLLQSTSVTLHIPDMTTL